MNQAAACVSATALCKAFEDKKARTQVDALKSIELNIPTGSLTALVGPDGAGKTTLLRLMAGLMKASSGSLQVLGFDVSADPQSVQDRISYMPQRFGLYEDLSVQENLDLYADLHGVPQAERQERYQRLLHMTDLARFTDRLAGKLSGGMKQKLGLACTLVRSPELLLLDEPTVGVDPLSRRELWEIIQQLIDDEQLSVIVSTSYLDEASRCDRVYVLHGGEMLAQGTPDQLRCEADDCAFLAVPAEGKPPRELQARLLDAQEQIVDAVPQGGGVRFVTQRDVDRSALEALLDGAHCQPLESDLEDGFMVLLRRRLGPVEANPEAFEGDGDGRNDEVVIEVRDLVRKFGDFTAVASTSFDVRRGEIFGLLGPNGAGKTTTFRMLCGLLPSSSGSLQVAGVNLRTASASARKRIGYVSQKFSLYANLTVLENLRFFGGAYGLRGRALKQRIGAMLDQFDLRGQEKTPSGQLPGGFKQRLAMAAGLIHEPEILFLDEPTSGADPLARRAFWRRITALAEGGTTIVITTHFMEEAEYCDRILIQDAGKRLAIGTPQQVRELVDEQGGNLSMEDTFIGIVERNRQPEKGAA
ncbi:ATP-binding cassette domain-containing protein [Marinobacterium mangrovicola]|uniref:ABC-2 type transport system ATP-binding protein n=1 Tax=Marinobacterium mangrovicola TaxID=1476959 RepID=A0A4R1GFW3_9GAMM|nr:ATP-binding cassette domain-containing protein [Marinobacterium mangrovicola]TCK05803.1 ABC-2 type transport system ATP-binding protein [Marinobacterium mangrovicola]